MEFSSAHEDETRKKFIEKIDKQDEVTVKMLKKNEAIADRFKLTFFAFYLLGIAAIFPYNFLMTADDYWLHKFRNLNSTKSQNGSSTIPAHDSKMQQTIIVYLNLVSNVSCFICLFINVYIWKWFSLKSRVISTQTIVLVLLIITTLFIYINTDGWQEYFFFFTLLLAFLINAFSTIFYGALVTITGLFSPNYITAYSAGQALSGIITTLIQILSLWIGMTHETSAFIYFMIGNVGILCSILAYILLEKQKFFKSHVYKHQNIQKKKINTGDVEEAKIEYKKIFKIIWPHGLSMFLLYGVTYCVYPSINVLIKSQMAPSPNEWSDKYFTPVATYLSFNCGDYFGRLVAGYFLWPNKKYMLVLITLLRILFIPTFMICNIKSEINILPILIDNDIIYTFLVFLFSTSNGYMCNILYQHVPKIVELQDEEVAMGFLGVFLGLGIAIGSGISVPIVNMLE